MIKLISIDAVRNAFLKGIDSFIELYQIQDNKNYISSTLGNAMMNLRGQGVHTNEITTIEIEKANRIKAVLNRDSNEDLKKLFKGFGKRLNQIRIEKCDRCFITTHYSFIALSVFHYACIAESHSVYSKNIFYFNMEKLLQYYLTPNTRHKEVILKLFKTIGDALENLDRDLLHDENTLDQMSLSQVSETEKLWAFICHPGSSMNAIAKNFLDDGVFSKYSTLGTKIVATKDLTNTSSERVKALSKISQQKIAEAFKNSQNILLIIKNISDGLLAYILKFDQNTSNPGDGKAVANYMDGQARGFVFEAANPHINLTKHITDIMGGAITEATDATIKTLQNLFPPAAIAGLVTSIVTTLVQISTKSKGYGIIHRHGVTGQVRALLLKNYLQMFSVFIQNQYSNIFLGKKDNDQIIKQCEHTIEIVEIFRESYKSSVEVLPNKNQLGSLYYYLSMYADPTDDANLAPNQEKIKEWNKSRVGNVYSDD